MEESKINLYKTLTVFVIIASLLAVTMIVTEVKSYRFVGGGVPATSTISVSGEGEVSATPDIAKVAFTVRKSAKKLADAQEEVNKNIRTALEGIKKAGIVEKDIKLQNYSSYPTYEWRQGSVSCSGVDCPPYFPGKQVLTGYEVSQSVVITIHNLDTVSEIIDGLGKAGVTDMQGPTFAIDKEDDFKAEARKQAIEKAQIKAEALAKDLNVKLIRVVSFSEEGNYPVYARAELDYAKGVSGGISPANLPELPKGEEKITSNVTISYEIR